MADDPIQRAAKRSRHAEDVDLHEVADWEPRSLLDHVLVFTYRDVSKGVVLAMAIIILLFMLVVTGLGAVVNPVVSLLVVLSAVPALLIAYAVWRLDVTASEPLSIMAVTFLLAVLFAGFAAVLNSIGAMVLTPELDAAGLTIGSILFFLLVVGPVEEGVKLLAVRLYAYTHEEFDAVIVGAVYGGVAGLGFATIENALYITQVLETADPWWAIAAGITGIRALVGPGHVLYSAIAGYYLGLARFLPDKAGFLVFKGVVVAALFHAIYNITVGFVPEGMTAITGLTLGGTFVIFVVGYNTIVGYYLYRKLKRYRDAYVSIGTAGSQAPPQHRPEPPDVE